MSMSILAAGLVAQKKVRARTVDNNSKSGNVPVSAEVGASTPAVDLVPVLLPAAVPGNSPVALA